VISTTEARVLDGLVKIVSMDLFITVLGHLQQSSKKSIKTLVKEAFCKKKALVAMKKKENDNGQESD
jgi:hypothetical protein